MSYLTWECFEKTLRSYKNAMKQIYNACPKMSEFGPGGGSPDTLRADCKPEYSSPALKHATRITAYADGLIEYGRPQLLQENSWAMTDWFKTCFSMSVSYNAYEIGTDGKEHQIEKHVHVSWEGKHFGLKDFKNNLQSILDYGKEMLPPIDKTYLAAVEEAKRKYDEWILAIKAIKPL